MEDDVPPYGPVLLLLALAAVVACEVFRAWGWR